MPHVYRSTHPAWNDRNLRELAASISSPLFFSHIRASTGTAIQETNTHPFRHGKWLWMHNGAIRGYETVMRELGFAVDPSLFPSIEGTTDSETMFYLALTFGLEDDPPAAVERMVGFVEETGTRHGVEYPIQMTVATSDGRAAVGVPLLERGRLAVALLQHARRPAARALSGRALSSTSSRTSPESSSRSRSATCPASGTPSPSRAGASSRRAQDELHPFTPGTAPEMHELERCRHTSRLRGARTSVAV